LATFEELKQQVSMKTLLEYFGAKFNSSGQANCIFPGHEDSTPSLSVENNQKFKCFGCGLQGDIFDVIKYKEGVEDSKGQKGRIEEILGLSSENFKPAKSPGNGKKKVSACTKDSIYSKAEKVYKYRDEEGKLSVLVANYGKGKDGKKIIRQFSPSEKTPGVWLNTAKGKEPHLYRLPELIEAGKKKERVFITEGEKDAETLREWGYAATTNRNGANSHWRKEDNKYFQDLEVILVPDNDAAGIKHANDIIENLFNVANKITVAKVPGVKDISDWKEAGGTKEEFEKFIEKADPIVEVGEEIKIENIKKEKKYRNSNRKSRRQKLIEAEDFLKSKYDFRFNIITYKPEYREKQSETWQELTDLISAKFLCDINKNATDFYEGEFAILLKNPDFSPPHNPFREYFDKLEYDNSRDFIKDFTDKLELIDNSERLYLEHFFKKWFVGILSGVYDDFWCNHLLFIIVGEQGDGKTSILNKLIPKKLRQYLQIGGLEKGDKDAKIDMCSKLLINIDELESFTKRNIDQLKSNITAKYFDIRMPFGRLPEKRLKYCSFMASTNRTSFLTDPTGSRRFLIFEVSNVKYQEKFDIDKMFAQAKHLYFSGFEYWLNKKEITYINGRNEKFSTDNPEEQLLLQYFKPISAELCNQLSDPIRKQKGIHIINTTEIATEIAHLTMNRISINNGFIRKLGGYLRKHNFNRISKNNRYIWCVQAISQTNSEEEYNEDSEELPF